MRLTLPTLAAPRRNGFEEFLIKHLAVRSRSANTEKPYTCSGLGDRIHAVTVGWCYGPPVTLHLTKDKWQGGQFSNKPQSWAEILSLFPAGIRLYVHDVAGLSESAWLQYLHDKGYDAQAYYYGDYPGVHEYAHCVDIAPRLQHIQRLPARSVDMTLPRAYVTAQWDATGAGRRVSVQQRAKAEQGYTQAGYEVVYVGGEARGILRHSLAHIAFAMSRAAYHIGVDSAFMHMAQLYMEPERVHLYAQELHSHHARRLIDRGGRLNLYA